MALHYVCSSESIEAVINPKIVSKSKETEVTYEGCLSLPGLLGPVERPREVDVEYLNAEGELKAAKLSGPPATIFQHEFDHLHGKLFIDHVADKSELVNEEEFAEMVMKI